MSIAKLIYGVDVIDGLKTLEPESVHCVVTSPPYWGLRDYGVDGQIGLEKMPEDYVSKMVEVFREVRRALRGDGTLWLNLGDSYSGSMSTDKAVINPNSLSGKSGGQTEGYRKEARGIVNGLKPKDLCGIPWRVAFALQTDGWWLRQDIIWSKPNPMPESVTDRCTKAHEYVFLMSKSARYYYDADAIKEPFKPISIERSMQDIENQVGSFRTHAGMKSNGPMKARGDMVLGANKRSVWEIATESYSEAHFATFPKALVLPCILAGCPSEGTVLDPFSGSGTVGEVATGNGRSFIGIDLNKKYEQMARNRIGLFVENR